MCLKLSQTGAYWGNCGYNIIIIKSEKEIGVESVGGWTCTQMVYPWRRTKKEKEKGNSNYWDDF